MKRKMLLTHEFVEYIPDDLKEGMIYVSMTFATVAHKCCCGCGNEVITPLTPTDWELTFDGRTISLAPSIGNWNFECQSHYWIKGSRVKWVGRWSQEEIEAGRVHDRLSKEKYLDSAKTPTINDTSARMRRSGEIKLEDSLWSKLKKWWS